MRRLVMTAVALFGLTIVVGATSAMAQNTIRPVPVDRLVCEQGLGTFDINGDGQVGKSDWYHWRNLLVSLNCPLGSPATGSCARLDLNGDGVIDLEDQQAFIDHYTVCAKRFVHPVHVQPGAGNVDPRP